MSKNNGFKIAQALTSVMQAGFSVLTPVIICIFGAKLLMDKFALPQITMVIAIILGVVSGVYSMFKYIYTLINKRGE